jgi:hypothetical protein
MNPLLRQFGLKLLSESLPDPARLALIRAWMPPRCFDGNQAIQSLFRERLAEASFPLLPPGRVRFIMQMELEVSRRVVETSWTKITRELRNKLLRSQAAYLSALYAALAAKLGEAAAQAEFEHLVLRVA